MRSNYKPLGEYIQEVNDRNTELNGGELLGVSIQKIMIPSIANTVGTDMSTYKLIKKNQFAYGPVTSRNGDKISVALYEDNEAAMISQAYTSFEVKDEKQLLPEYLMMWFRRSEFDRYARFKSHGSAREIFDWDEMCNTLLPVPHPDKQKEIVAEYNTIQNRIALNQQLIQKLEETAQAIYKQWFVEFEFPNENKMPYKSSGGKMVWNEELEKEIPRWWEVKPFTSVVKFGGGGTPSTTRVEYWNGTIPFYTPGDLAQHYYCISTEKKISEFGLQKCSSKLYPKNTVFITARGATVGGVGLAGTPMAMNQTCYAVNGNGADHFFIHQLALQLMSSLKNEAVGATFEALVTRDFDAKNVIAPPSQLQEIFDTNVSQLYDYMLLKTMENQKLRELKDLLLSKLATVE